MNEEDVQRLRALANNTDSVSNDSAARLQRLKLLSEGPFEQFKTGFARPFQALAGAIQGDPVTRENAFRAIRGEPPLPVEEPLPETMAGRMGEVSGETLMMSVPFGAALTRLKPAADSINRIAPSLRNNAIAIQNILSGTGQTFRANPVRFATEIGRAHV
jgi:hypothetical protein